MEIFDIDGAVLGTTDGAPAGWGDSFVATICAPSVPGRDAADTRPIRNNSCQCANAGSCRLKREHRSKSNLIIGETECIDRTLILSMQIIRTNRPESSD